MKRERTSCIVDLISTRSNRVEPGINLRDVASHMLGTKSSSVIVVEENVAVGIITERDIVRFMRQHLPPEQTAREFMTSPVHCVPANMPFQKAYREATALGIRHIVVIDPAGQPLGIVNESDFRKHLGTDFFLQLNTADTLMERTFPRLTASARLDDALTAMDAVSASCVFVVDGKKPLGIVTEHDALRLFLDNLSNPTLEEVMTRPAITIPADHPLTDAAQLMLDRNIRHLGIVDQEGWLVGMLSEHALMSPLSLGHVDSALSEQQSVFRCRERMLEEIAANERYQRALLDNFPFLVWLKDTDSRFLTTNRAFANAVSLPGAQDLVGKTDLDFWPDEMANQFRADDFEVMTSRKNKIVVEPIIVNQQVTWHETYKAPVVGEDGALLGTVGFARDISEQKRAEQAMQLRNAALAAMIGGESLGRALELLAMSVEAEMADWRCSIMLCDESRQQLTIGAAPSLPSHFSKAIDGMRIDEGLSSCSMAAAQRQRVIVENIFEQAQCAPFHDLARQTEIAACWSDPIIGPDGLLLGTFAAFSRAPARPSEKELGILTLACQLAALLIDHHHRSLELGGSLETFQGIFNSISEALVILGEDGRFLDVNSGAELLAGASRAQLIGEAYQRFIEPGLTNVSTVERHLEAAFGGTPNCFEIFAKSCSGDVFPAEVRFQKAKYFAKPVVIASVIDITERKNAELRLEVEHDLAQALAANLPRDAALFELLKSTLRFPNIDAATLHTRQADGSYRLTAYTGLSEEFARQIEQLAPDAPLARAATSGKSICNCLPTADHCCDEPIFASQALQAEGLGCLAAMPLIHDGAPVACITLCGHADNGILPSTLRSLDLLGCRFSQGLQQIEAQEVARQLQHNLSGVFDSLKHFIFVVSHQGTILHYNRAVAEDLGYGPTRLIGQPISVVHPEALRAQGLKMKDEVLANLRSTFSLPLLDTSGRQVMVETHVTHGYWDGQPALIGTSQDISERLIAEERQKLAASVFDNAHEGIVITDSKGIILEVNSTFSELTGYAREEAIGKTPSMLKSGHHDPGFYREMWEKIAEDGYWRGEIWNRKKSGEIFVELLTISSVRNRKGDIANFVAIFSDITLIKQHQQRLEHLAHYDALTQLPNRMLLGDRLQLAMAQTERSGKMLAICYLDLDNFKPINDRFGHSAGDFLLIEVAQRLKSCVRSGDTVSRLGGDEFVLLVSNLDDVHECNQAINRIISALTQPFRISEHTVTISASIGVTLYPHDGSDADTLIRHADQAMYAAKQGGRNRHHLFDPENDRRTRVRREEIVRIREGLANGEFRLYFQPKVNMRKGLVTGAEALIRWQHPIDGLLLPGRFLPALEDSEVDIELGDWVIREALQQMEKWHDQGVDLPVSINISGKHLQHEGFSRRLGELLAAHPKVSPGQIELEVLETAALEDMANVAELFAECRRLGVSFALDDFGTGYSSLTYFRQLPADVLKIDQSFIRNMLDDSDDLAIVEGVIGLTQAFRRQVIAEGVETVEHGLILLLLGCDMAQGFGIAHPMPAIQLPEWIRGFRPDELWGLATAFKWSHEDLPMLIADVDHNRWKKALLAYLDDKTDKLQPPELDHHQCRFGRWYYSDEGQRYADVEAFRMLEGLHRHLHVLAGELVACHDSGTTSDLGDLKRDFETQSLRLTECIQQIQAEVLLNSKLPRQ
ncbi:MAG: putative signaling protein [Proteobacteria bacterium]|nr:putative signaling protein [Pseudomonadota bacterium]